MQSNHYLAWLTALTMILTTGLAGCDIGRRKPDTLMQRWAAKCKEAADLLAGIKDVPSAKLAEPKLKVALRELAQIGEQMEQLQDREEDYISDARFELKHQLKGAVEGIAEMQRLTLETQRISKQPELKEALGDTWKELPSAAILEANGEL